MRPPWSRISHTAATGRSPASRHRSGAASVWPARRSTPPGTARSGKMCPGRTRSLERVSGRASARSVLARSKAEVPVVVPLRTSTDSVNGVPNLAVFCATMSFKPRRSAILGRHRSAQDAAAVREREVHHCRRGALGREHQIALVLPLLVVDHDDHLAGRDAPHRLLDSDRDVASETGGFRTRPRGARPAVRTLGFHPGSLRPLRPRAAHECSSP